MAAHHPVLLLSVKSKFKFQVDVVAMTYDFSRLFCAVSSVVLCKVDLSKEEGLILYIKKLRPTSACEMKINSVTKENITVTSKSELSFQDCTPEDVEVTAMKVIGKSRYEGRTGDSLEIEDTFLKWSILGYKMTLKSVIFFF